MLVVLNRAFGGFSLSKRLLDYMEENVETPSERAFVNGCKKYGDYRGYGEAAEAVVFRSNPFLVRCVRAVGEKESGGVYAGISVVEVPDWLAGNCYIEERDGFETLHENHFST